MITHSLILTVLKFLIFDYNSDILRLNLHEFIKYHHIFYKILKNSKKNYILDNIFLGEE